MKKGLLVIGILVLAAALAVGGFFGYEAYRLSQIPDPAHAVTRLMGEAFAAAAPAEAASEEGKALAEVIRDSRSYEPTGNTHVNKREASQTVVIRTLDENSLYDGLEETAQAVLTQAVEQAGHSGDVYDEGLNYRTEVLALAAGEAFRASLKNYDTRQFELRLELRYEQEQWQLSNLQELCAALETPDPDALAAELCAAAVESPEYVRKIYTIPENAKAGPVPNPDKFGSTTDPAEVEALLATPLAQELIGGQELVWNPDIAFLPGTEIHWYLDESILTIVWQEVEALAVGTFSETFIADGSQLRRKIADDTFQSFAHNYATEFSKQTNAVLAVGGDLYHHDRACGIMVYERDIYRFDPVTCDTCYITADGDMLFSYREQFSQQAEAEQFIEENDVLFSLCFGPVLIDNGVDVTPETYPWGEVNDTYARSALGMLGDKHYLTMNINCQQPGYYYLATLRQAADAMVKRGCTKAYALDGGQTACTILNHKLINPVQFGAERVTSDILYFATAVPNS